LQRAALSRSSEITAFIMDGAGLMAMRSRTSLLRRFILPIISSSAAFTVENLRLRSYTSTTSKPAVNGIYPPGRGNPILLGQSASAAADGPAVVSGLSSADLQHMKLAAKLARIGKGNTFPNPAVGCVIVRNADESILGCGFHPKAGKPHAEVFALLEACGHVSDGVAAATTAMDLGDSANEGLSKQVSELFDTYISEDGASKLFNNQLGGDDVTAYVTLEPCCHYGKTPPCSQSLLMAGVSRVVVGYRDPNPRVDGGGIKQLQDSGLDVSLLGQSDSKEEASMSRVCHELVEHFVKRISPREDSSSEETLDAMINGKKRRAIRSIVGRQKSEGTVHEVAWPRDHAISKEDKVDQSFAERVAIDHRFLERVDEALWDHEIVLLRLKNVVQKKKGAKIVGERVAKILDAHLAQVVGHTALLYRPGFPPRLNLDELVESEAQ